MKVLLACVGVGAVLWLALRRGGVGPLAGADGELHPSGSDEILPPGWIQQGDGTG